MNKTILVVDDEKEIAELLEIHLISNDYKVLKAYNGKDALSKVKDNKVDLVLLDVMMPGIDGIEVCKKIREFSNVPIIMVTAKASDADMVRGLGIGADDYVSKPINVLNLIARIKAQLRRYTQLNPNKSSEDEISGPDEITVKNLFINRVNHEVIIDGEKMKVSPTEFNILYLLASNPGKVFSTDEIFESVWHGENFGAAGAVMTHIKRLRVNIKDNEREDKIITTVWGVGYKIEKWFF